jgi:hypothetical protein
VEILGLLLGYSFLTGVTDTMDDFPIVAFSGQEGLPPKSIPVLLGSDDKEFAFLIVYPEATSEQVHRYVLYMPRTEIKWMTVLRLMSLQRLAKLDELKKILKPTQ